MPSTDDFSVRERIVLLGVAVDSIRHGLSAGYPLPTDAQDYPEALRPLRATFVTLHHEDHLRGCIGTLEATLPLVEDVAAHAYAAAFTDPRFLPLSKDEIRGLEISVSVLSPPELLMAASESELLAMLRRGTDGLILREGRRRSTFLPSVWKDLPDPRMFLAHLKRKAGLAENYWSPALRFERYTATSMEMILSSQIDS